MEHLARINARSAPNRATYEEGRYVLTVNRAESSRKYHEPKFPINHFGLLKVSELDGTIRTKEAGIIVHEVSARQLWVEARQFTRIGGRKRKYRKGALGEFILVPDETLTNLQRQKETATMSKFDLSDFEVVTTRSAVKRTSTSIKQVEVWQNKTFNRTYKLPLSLAEVLGLTKDEHGLINGNCLVLLSKDGKRALLKACDNQTVHRRTIYQPNEKSQYIQVQTRVREAAANSVRRVVQKVSLPYQADAVEKVVLVELPEEFWKA